MKVIADILIDLPAACLRCAGLFRGESTRWLVALASENGFLDWTVHQKALTADARRRETVLHCNMEPKMMDSQWGLDDLLADLYHARKRGDLGRLAFVAYCDVRRWAREAGRHVLAEQASRLITESPHQSREVFLVQIDQLILDLEALRQPTPTSHSRSNGSSGWSAAPAVA